MTDADPYMNLEVLSRSRKKIRAGDIFVMKMPQAGYIHGRVISTDANVFGDGGDILIYIYAPVSPDELPIPTLSREDLLVPPLIANRRPWTMGYFKFLEHRELTEEDVLAQHCFATFEGHYYDERGNRLPERTEPCGSYGLWSFKGVDCEVSKALGITPAPYDPDAKY